MPVPENIILAALSQGGCIKSFYRTTVKIFNSSERPVVDGYVLETPHDGTEVMITHVDFLNVCRLLDEKEKWDQIVGGTVFGGSTWVIRETVTGG